VRLALDLRRGINSERLSFGRQIGCTDAVAGPWCLPQDRENGYYDLKSLVGLRKAVEAADMKLAAVENVYFEWYDRIARGQQGRDEQIEKWQLTLRNMGRAEIPILGYHFMALGVWRTSSTKPGRGGAMVTSYEHRLVEDAPVPRWGPLSDEQMWDNVSYFLKAVIPVAEEAGVRMGLHPDDPPVDAIGGVARIFRNHAALRRLTEEIYLSDYNGLEFCQGTVSEMPDDIYEGIRYFGGKKKIWYVHFRNVSGQVPDFDETFIDEGYVDMYRAMQMYREVGFDGPMIDDHVPAISGDSAPDGPYRSEAFAMGYYKAFIDKLSK
jgi:mannonate dehydratase